MRSDDATTREVQLKPCPFCGHEAAFERIGTPRQSCIVACEWCGARHESSDTWDSGSSWNDRIEDPRIATLAAEVERLQRQSDGWERRVKHLGSVVLRAWVVLRGWWHYGTEERDDEPFAEALERAVAAAKAHDAYALAEAQKWRDATATARSNALREVREKVAAMVPLVPLVDDTPQMLPRASVLFLLDAMAKGEG